MQFFTLSTFAILLGFLSINVQCLPVSEQSLKRETSKIECDYENAISSAHLYQISYMYGGYSDLQVAEQLDELPETGSIYAVQPSAKSYNLAIQNLTNILQVQCNSTSLGYYSRPNVYGTNTPVKLLTTMNDKEGNELCIGLQNKPNYEFDSSTNKSYIALVPCSDEDSIESQGNQFWVSAYKYSTLLPLVGKASPPTNNGEFWLNNFWAIKPPSENTTDGLNLYHAIGNINSQEIYNQYVSFQMGQY